MIRIQDLSVVLPGFSLRHIDLTVPAGEFFTLIGPTGAGKTLILESVAGIVPLSAGKVHVNGCDVTALPPDRRGIGIVYQDHALFPHLTVLQNIRFGLRYHRGIREKAEKRITFLIGRLSLAPLLNRSVTTLSGGERQRVALARALAVVPAVLLLDEPLSALDPNFREEIREILKNLHRETGITVVMVTHDFGEAHYLAQRVGVVHAGRIEQVGTVAEVFHRPATPFVARFVGMKNVFPADFRENGAMVEGLPCTLKIAKAAAGSRYVAIRPEDIRIRQEGDFPPDGNVLAGTVSRVLNQGLFSDVGVRAGAVEFRTIISAGALFREDIREGRQVLLAFDPAAVHVL